MIAGIIAVGVLLSYMGWIMFSFWFVGKFYYDRVPRPDAGAASLMTFAMILIPVAFLIGASLFG